MAPPSYQGILDRRVRTGNPSPTQWRPTLRWMQRSFLGFRSLIDGSEAIHDAEVAVRPRGRQHPDRRRGGRDRSPPLGEPIGETIVGQGPFVMNRPEEIRQAIADYQSGRMGLLS